MSQIKRLLQASILLISAVTCISPQDVTLAENGTYPAGANTAYPVSVLEKGKEMLDEALKVASKNTSGEFAKRVKFLQAGLEHAKLSSIFMGKATSIDSPEGKKAAQKALQELIEFRRKHEHMYISDFLNAASRETRRVDFNTLLN